MEFNVPFQRKYGYIRDERSQFIADTVEPSVFLPGIISLVIMCIGIIWNNSFLVGRRARAEAEARIDPRPLRTSRSTAHGAQVVWPLDYMCRAHGRVNILTRCTLSSIVKTPASSTMLGCHYQPVINCQLLLLHSNGRFPGEYRLRSSPHISSFTCSVKAKFHYASWFEQVRSQIPLRYLLRTSCSEVQCSEKLISLLHLNWKH